MRPTVWIGVAAASLAWGDSTLHGQNVQELTKWASAQMVHYDVVAEFAGPANVMVTTVPVIGGALTYSAQVQDRFEVGFDWSPTSMELMGKPTFKNFASSLPKGTPPGREGCASPKPAGTYEHADVTDAKNGPAGSNALVLSLKRTQAAGAVPYVNENGCNNWANAAATVVTTTLGMQVPPGMYLAMPQAAGNTITVGTDGKTMVLDDKASNWKYTYTLRIVK